MSVATSALRLHLCLDTDGFAGGLAALNGLIENLPQLAPAILGVVDRGVAFEVTTASSHTRGRLGLVVMPSAELLMVLRTAGVPAPDVSAAVDAFWKLGTTP